MTDTKDDDDKDMDIHQEDEPNMAAAEATTASSPRRSTRVRTTVLKATTTTTQEADEGDKETPTKTRRVKRIVKKTKVSSTAEASPNPVSPDDDENNNDKDDDDDDEPQKKRKAAKRVRPVKNDNSDAEDDDDDDNDNSSKKKKKKPSPVSKQSRNSSSGNKAATEGPKASNTLTKKKAKAPPHQVLTEKVELPRLWDPNTDMKEGSTTLKIASWNVAGLRALLKKTPNVLQQLATQHNLDILCLQETKLQEQHLDDPKLRIPTLADVGYQAFYSCSVAKKGYSGTAVFVHERLGKLAVEEEEKDGDADAKSKQTKKTKSKQQTTMDQFIMGGGSNSKNSKAKRGEASDSKPSTSDDTDTNLPKLQHVSYKMGKDKHDAEGRLVMLDFSCFSLCNVYVPNSGQKLERLDYRTKDWDKDFLSYMQEKQKERGFPVLWLGDLNVAHTHLEVWNDGAKHLPKQAGVTPQERESFQAQLDAGFVDAFRHLHPQTSGGHYTYWSQRAGNRPVNKGLRLDYFVCDPKLFDESCHIVARDSYMLEDQQGSDHCPVVLELEFKGEP